MDKQGARDANTSMYRRRVARKLDAIQERLGEPRDLRDWFAGQALAGLLAGDAFGPQDAAYEAYNIADAMLAQRERARGRTQVEGRPHAKWCASWRGQPCTCPPPPEREQTDDHR